MITVLQYKIKSAQQFCEVNIMLLLNNYYCALLLPSLLCQRKQAQDHDFSVA